MAEKQFDILQYLCDDSDLQGYEDTVVMDFGCEIDSFLAKELDLLQHSVKTAIRQSGSSLCSSSYSPAAVTAEDDSNPLHLQEQSTTVECQIQEMCPVCSRKLGKHSYYGGRVCVSCRGFFSRSVQNGQHPLFRCSDDCILDTKTKKTCKSCRFRKCVAAGMKTSWVMTEGERKERLLKKTLVRKVSHVFTLQEELQYKKLYMQYMEYGHARYYAYFASHLSTFQSLMDHMIRGSHSIPVYLFNMCELMDEEMTRNFSLELPEMSALPSGDRMALVTGNFTVMFGICYAVFYNYKDLDYQFQNFIDFGLRHRDTDASINHMMSMLNIERGSQRTVEPLLDEVAAACTPLMRETFDTHHLQDYKNTMSKINPWIRKEQSAQVDEIIVILLVLISTYNPGYLTLGSRRTVELIHDNYVWALHRYLKTKYSSESAKRLHQVLMVMTYATKVYDLQKSRRESEIGNISDTLFDYLMEDINAL